MKEIIKDFLSEDFDAVDILLYGVIYPLLLIAAVIIGSAIS